MEENQPLSDAIAQGVVDKLPMETEIIDTDPRMLPGLHLSLFWGLIRVDFNQPQEMGGMPTIVHMATAE